jgi:hypothetical protein
MKKRKLHHLSTAALFATSMVTSSNLYAETGYIITGNKDDGFQCKPISDITTRKATLKDLDIAVEGTSFEQANYNYQFLTKGRLSGGVTVDTSGSILKTVKKHHPNTDFSAYMYTKVTDCKIEKLSHPIEGNLFELNGIAVGTTYQIKESSTFTNSSYVSVTQSTQSSSSNSQEVTANMSFSYKGIGGGSSATANQSESLTIENEQTQSTGTERQSSAEKELSFTSVTTFLGVLLGVDKYTYKVAVTFESSFGGYFGVLLNGTNYAVHINSVLGAKIKGAPTSKVITTKLSKVIYTPPTIGWHQFNDKALFDEALKAKTDYGFTETRL